MALELSAIRALVPINQKTMVTADFVARLDEISKDPKMGEVFKESFISYLGVLAGLGKRYSIEDYVDAVKYVSFKLLGYSTRDAWIATFPEKYERLLDEYSEKPSELIDGRAIAYNKTKLVMQIYEQTIVPSYVLNAPLHQEAINELAMMIKDPNVRGLTKVQACKAILEFTQQPQIVKGELNISMEQNDTIAKLHETTEQMAEVLKNAIAGGNISLRQATELSIVDAEHE